MTAGRCTRAARSASISTGCFPLPAPAGYALRTRRDAGWLVGKAYSIADIAAAPFAKRIDEEIAPDEMTEKKHPHVAAWRTRLQAPPAYAEANFGPFVDF